MKKINFGISTWVFTSPFQTSSIDLLFPKIAEMGFDTVEIAVEDPSLIDGLAVKRALDRYQLKAIVCGAFGPDRDLTHEDPRVHKQCMDYISSCMDLCVLWGVPFFSGPMYSAVGKARMLEPDQRKAEWNLAVKNLRLVCDMAANRGLKIAIEPLNRFESDLINTAEDVSRLVEDINHPAAGILLDGFHMNIEEPDLFKAITLAGDKLLHIQVAENYRGTPGSGQTNWQEYKRALETIRYEGTVTIETFTPANKALAAAVCIWRPLSHTQEALATDGLKFLKELLLN